MTFTQNAAYQHADGSDLADNVYSIDVVITDSDGNSVTQTVNVDISDDSPSAVADTDSVVEGADITGGDVLGNDSAGADGYASAGAVVAVGTASGATGGVASAITGSKGTLTLNADGSYTYAANPGAAPGTDVFYYTIEDADGDTSETTLTITITESNLGATVDGDIQTSDADLASVHRADPAHWSWSFRQLSRWRSLLMDGAESEGMLGPADFAVTRDQSVAPPASVPAPTLTDAEKDAALASFIQLVKTRPDLKDQVKSARNQDEVIGLAQAQGFAIDSLTLLRSWSQVSDFTKPTWFGWFDD